MCPSISLWPDRVFGASAQARYLLAGTTTRRQRWRGSRLGRFRRGPVARERSAGSNPVGVEPVRRAQNAAICVKVRNLDTAGHLTNLTGKAFGQHGHIARSSTASTRARGDDRGGQPGRSGDDAADHASRRTRRISNCAGTWVNGGVLRRIGRLPPTMTHLRGHVVTAGGHCRYLLAVRRSRAIRTTKTAIHDICAQLPICGADPAFPADIHTYQFVVEAGIFAGELVKVRCNCGVRLAMLKLRSMGDTWLSPTPGRGEPTQQQRSPSRRQHRQHRHHQHRPHLRSRPRRRHHRPGFPGCGNSSPASRPPRRRVCSRWRSTWPSSSSGSGCRWPAT